MKSQFEFWLNDHVEDGKKLAEHIISQAQARQRQAAKYERRRTSTVAVLPGKLTDCESSDITRNELFIVEGDSAGGSAKQGRDKEFQAVLPLRGKILNTWEVDGGALFRSDTIHDIALAIGVDPHLRDGEPDLKGLRYGKICILSDADVDGSHIRTLLLTFFFRFMRPLIDGGYVYSAIPPLYKLNRGKTARVAFSDEERDKISAEMRGDNPNAKIDINRFKGLGEMDPHELWETTMNPETRTLKQITLEDAVHADEVFTVLMGEKVEPRKAFIEQNAKYAVNIDI